MASRGLEPWRRGKAMMTGVWLRSEPWRATGQGVAVGGGEAPRSKRQDPEKHQIPRSEGGCVSHVHST
jgi:hypothetical protein